MEATLQHLIYGQPVSNDLPQTDFEILAISADWGTADAHQLSVAIPLMPHDDGETPADSRALALVGWPLTDAQPTQFILARSEYQVYANGQLPAYQYVALPAATLVALQGNLQPLLRLIATPIPVYRATHVPLEPLTLTSTEALSAAERTRRIQDLLNLLPGDSFTLASGLLAALLDERPLVLSGFAGDLTARMQLVYGLMALLPQPMQAALTFTTHADRLTATLPRLVFIDTAPDTATDVCLIQWAQLSNDDTNLPQHLYARHLATLWAQDPTAFPDHLLALDALAQRMALEVDLNAALLALATRHQQDLAVQTGGEIPMQAIIDVLNGPDTPQGEQRYHYIQRLLLQALEERDTEASKYIADLMDADADLEAHLTQVLDNALEDQPDAVYFFVRTRLSTHGPDEQWLERLHKSAAVALDVAITSGDPNTLAVWMRLISREPATYNLGDILREGIIAARKRVSEDNNLARELITIAVKRDLAALSSILEDETVLNALSDELLGALRDHDRDAIEHMAEQSREIFLLALARAIDSGTRSITSTAIRSLWDYYKRRNAVILSEPYRPNTIIHRLAADGETSLVDGALETLLTLILASNNDDSLFFDIAPDLSERSALAPLLVPVLEQCGRPLDDQLELVGKLTTDSIITPQQAVDIYTTLLADQDWDASALPLVEQLTRLLNQNADVITSMGVLWKILDLGSSLRSEVMIRSTTRRLLAEISDVAVETQLIDHLGRLRRVTGWSNNIQNMLLTWWRTYTRNQSIGQLQKLDRALDGKRPLDDLRRVVQTTLALRRLIGQKSLAQFAEDISTAYNVLQAIADGFDPSNKQSPITIDLQTVRDEIAARDNEITLDAQHVLATNLRELAQIITSLSDNRSKSSLMRSDDMIERQLVTGEQQPQGAIDIMKWLSGYLDGSQAND